MKRIILAIAAVFLGIFVSDFIIHGVLLSKDYAATKELWRPEAEMQAYMGWMFLGQFVAAATFVLVWATGFAGRADAKMALMFGGLMALFGHAGAIINYAVQPTPGLLVIKWVVAAIGQGLLLGLLVYIIYRRPVRAN